MYILTVESDFSSAHQLRGYRGKCENLHGHNWKVKVTVRVRELDKLGMGVDFKTLKQQVNIVVDELDHRDLNEHPAFQDCNPSSEHIARYFFIQLKGVLTTERYQIHAVEVRETDSSGVIYYGG